VTVNWEEVFMSQLRRTQKMAFASTWGKMIMTILNPLEESPIFDCSNAARIRERNTCRFFCTGMIVLIQPHFLYYFKCERSDYIHEVCMFT
jgi:hypothetical protein